VLRVYFILGSFCCILGRFMNFMLYSTSLFAFYPWVCFFYMFYKFLNLFALTLTPNWIWFDSPWMPLCHYASGGKEKPKNFKTRVIMTSLWWRSWSVVSLNLLASSSSFILWPKMLEFMLKKVVRLQKREESSSHFSLIFLIFFIRMRIPGLYFRVKE